MSKRGIREAAQEMSEAAESLISDLPEEEKERIRRAQVFPTQDRPAWVASLNDDFELTIERYAYDEDLRRVVGTELCKLEGIHQGEDLMNCLKTALPALEQSIKQTIWDNINKKAEENE